MNQNMIFYEVKSSLVASSVLYRERYTMSREQYK